MNRVELAVDILKGLLHALDGLDDVPRIGSINVDAEILKKNGSNIVMN